MQTTMEWSQILALIGSNVALMVVSMGSTLGLFLWARSEARSDQQELRETLAADRKDILQIIREIKDEMKDFHTRLAMQDQEYKNHLIQFHEKNKLK